MKYKLLTPNPPWHYTTLDRFVVERILNAIPKVLVQNQIAHLAGIAPKRLSDWLKYGKRDVEAGLENSIYADFYIQYHKKRAEVLSKKIEKLEKLPKNHAALTWLLDRCYKEDFASLPDDVQKVLDYVINEIGPKVGIGKGVSIDGEIEEVHTESYQESRCITQGVESTIGRENTSIEIDKGTAF